MGHGKGLGGPPALEAVGVNGGRYTILQAAQGVNSIPSALSGLGGISLVSMIRGGGGDWTNWEPPHEIDGDPTGEDHHIATNKHESYWRAIFDEIFKNAGMGLEDDWNIIRVNGHRGRHLGQYHQYIFDELRIALNGLEGNPYRHALQERLWYFKQELMTPGSYIRRLLIDKSP